MVKQFYDPPDVFRPNNLYSHGVRSGRTLTVAGQAPLHDDGTVVDAGDPEIQCRRVFADLRKTLDMAGVSFDDIVYVRAYLTNRTVLPVLIRVATEIFASNRPTFTPVVVPACRGEGVLVEIELVADLGE